MIPSRLLTFVLGSMLACGPAPSTAPIATPATPATPTPTATTAAPPAEVAADLALLARALDELHPGRDRYQTAADRAAAFREASAALAVRSEPADVVLALTRLTATLRCGHTFPNPYNQSDALIDAVYRGPRVPFAFRWLDGAMVVTRSLVGDAGLAPGTVIEAIDGVPAAALLTRLLPLGRSDGGNEAKRLASLEVHGRDRHEAFDLLAPLVAPELAPPYAVTAVGPDGRRFTRELPAMTYDERQAVRPPDPTEDRDAPLWGLTWLDRDTAYLAMPTWVAYKTRWDWQGDLVRIATEVAARPRARLIVDLRGNEGGSDVGSRLLAHYLDRPVPRRGQERWVRFQRVADDLRPHLDTWDPSFFELGVGATADDAGWWRLPDEPGDQVIAPARPRLRGRLIVLVDASNSSATFQFASRVQAMGLGTLVGEPTGGNQRGINGGSFFFLRLPNTGVEVDVPLVATFPPGRAVTAVPDAGLTPDVVVPTTVADLAAGRDPQLTAARALR